MSKTEITKAYEKMTRHPEGSMRELFTISFPLMLSMLSGYLMMFLDRLILSRYSTEAMTASVLAGSVVAIFHFGGIGIASIAEVFVGQYNGAKKFHKTGEPVWQMIWFSLFLSVIFIPCALFAGPYLVMHHENGILSLQYYQVMMWFGSAFPLAAALSSFYIGIGRVKLVMTTAILGNVLNVLLDFAFVFGVEGLIPSMGIKGAALATGISQLVQVVILFSVFQNRHFRTTHGTNHYRFYPKEFWKQFKVGFPNAAGHMIEISAWAFLAVMMAKVSDDHLTVLAVGQSFYILFAFAIEGLQKGVIAIAANFIGADKWDKIPHLFRSGVKLILLFCLLWSIPMLVYPDPIINQFLVKEDPGEIIEMRWMIRIACIFVWYYFIVDGLVWVSAGILTAAGDTKFVMVINAITVWLFAILPAYVLIMRMGGPPSMVWAVTSLYGTMNALLFFLRYKSGRWKNLQVTAS